MTTQTELLQQIADQQGVIDALRSLLTEPEARMVAVLGAVVKRDILQLELKRNESTISATNPAVTPTSQMERILSRNNEVRHQAGVTS
jgi:hypothetical protein